jgi:hypothetical protein
MFPARLPQTGSLFFFRPSAEEFAPELLELWDGQLLSLICGAACGHRPIHHVGDGMKAGQHLRTPSQSLLQTAETSLCYVRACVFIVHEPLQIYKTIPRIQAYFMGTSKIYPPTFPCTAL